MYMPSSRKQRSSYGMKLLCSTATVQRPLIVPFTTSLRIKKHLEASPCCSSATFARHCLSYPEAPGPRSSMPLSEGQSCGGMSRSVISPKTCAWIAPQKARHSQNGFLKLVLDPTSLQKRPSSCFQRCISLKITSKVWLTPFTQTSTRATNLTLSSLSAPSSPPKMIPLIRSTRWSLTGFQERRLWSSAPIRSMVTVQTRTPQSFSTPLSSPDFHWHILLLSLDVLLCFFATSTLSMVSVMEHVWFCWKSDQGS